MSRVDDILLTITTLILNQITKSERLKEDVSSKKKTIPRLQHMLNLMYHNIGFKLILVVKLLVYRVDNMSRDTHLSLPTLIRYLTTR